MFSVEATSRHQALSLSMDDAEVCLMTPPKKSVFDTVQWTPTANLKLLLKAASPDMRCRETLHSQSDLKLMSFPKASGTVDVGREVNCNLNTDVDVMTIENVPVSMEKRRRKDNSLGLLCERYHTVV